LQENLRCLFFMKALISARGGWIFFVEDNSRFLPVAFFIKQSQRTR
jgi:hypothetical protein